MNIDGVQVELRLHDDSFANWLSVKTDSGKTILKKKQWSQDPSVLQRRTAQIVALRKSLQAAAAEPLSKIFDQVSANEKVAKKVLDTEDSFAEECYGQLLFRHELLQPINYIPFFLIVLRFWKIYVQPASAILMPLAAIVMPYIIIRFFFGLKMPVSAYIAIVKEFYSGNGFQGLMPTSELDGQLGQVVAQAKSKAPQDFLGKIKFYAQTGWLIFSFLQSMWQPIQAAQHLAVLDKTLCEQGAAVRTIYAAATTIRDSYARMGIKVPRLPIEEHEVADDRMAVATCLDSPNRFRLLLELVGEWEVFYRFAVHPDICPVQWLPVAKATATPAKATAGPIIKLTKTFDIHIDAAKRIPFSVALGTKKHQQHALLTGPNRGGKSTALRSIGRSVYLAHNFGIAIGVAAAMTPMSYIQTCLRLEDIPGNSSLFEREVAVASLALARSTGAPGLLLIDELFHSTNPPDAEIASHIFLEQLWKSKKTISVISTHMFQLLEDENHGIQKLCCPAEYGPNETVKYHYGLTQGICKVSSVKEILREQGFSADQRS
jgi:hypothetical protein